MFCRLLILRMCHLSIPDSIHSLYESLSGGQKVLMQRSLPLEKIVIKGRRD